ncbi:hypothetical protein CsSME_00009906 [Camellia sinensis var. sinensis]
MKIKTVKMMSCGGLPKRRHQDKDSEDDDNNDDVEDLFTIEETEESDEVETSEMAESNEQTTDDSEAVVGVETIDKELPEASDEGMDDDAMFRMDTYLERILNEHKNQAGGETAHS